MSAAIRAMAPPRMMLCAAVLALLAGEARGLKEHLAVEGGPTYAGSVLS